MSTLLSDTRKAIGAALNGCTGGSGPTALVITTARTIYGFDSFLQSTNASIYDDCKANGVRCVIGPTNMLDVDSLHFGPMTVTFKLYFVKSKQANWDGFDIDDLIDAVLAVLCTEANFGVPSGFPLSIRPRKIRYKFDGYQTDDCDGLVQLGFSCEIPDP